MGITSTWGTSPTGWWMLFHRSCGGSSAVCVTPAYSHHSLWLLLLVFCFCLQNKFFVTGSFKDDWLLILFIYLFIYLCIYLFIYLFDFFCFLLLLGQDLQELHMVSSWLSSIVILQLIVMIRKERIIRAVENFLFGLSDRFRIPYSNHVGSCLEHCHPCTLNCSLVLCL